MLNPQYIIVHHSGGTDKDPLADTSHHTFDMVKSWHLAMGWDDIGYNYFINKEGKLSVGRSLDKVGAHTKGYNDKSIGICLAGNFDLTLPTKAQTDTLTKLLKELVAKYNITSERIVPHRKFAKKTCYGNKLSDTWASDLIKGQKTLQDYSSKELLDELYKRI